MRCQYVDSPLCWTVPVVVMVVALSCCFVAFCFILRTPALFLCVPWLETLRAGLTFSAEAATPSARRPRWPRPGHRARRSTSTASRAYISDIYEGDERAKYFGYIGVCLATGMMMGPVLGGAAAEISTRMPFIISAGLSVINLILAIVFLKESHQPSSEAKPFAWNKSNPLTVFKKLIQKSDFQPYLIVFTLIILAHTSYMTVFSFVTMEKFDWSPLDFGLCLMAFGIAGLIGQGFLIDRAVKYWGLDKSILYGVIFYLIGFLLIGFAGHPIWVYISVPVAGVAGIFGATIVTKITKLVDSDNQGEIQGIIASASGLMLMIGPILMAEIFAYTTRAKWPISQSIKSGSPFLLGGALSLICLAILWKAFRRPAQEASQNQVAPLLEE